MKTLKELQAGDVPHASCETIGLVLKGEASDLERGRRIMDAYFRDFTAPRHEIGDPLALARCVRCERTLSGIFGTFTWGLCSGEGYCSNCNYPARAFHRIGEDGDKGKCYATLNDYILQYHPLVLSEDTEQMDADGQVCRVG